MYLTFNNLNSQKEEISVRANPVLSCYLILQSLALAFSLDTIRSGSGVFSAESNDIPLQRNKYQQNNFTTIAAVQKLNTFQLNPVKNSAWFSFAYRSFY